MGRVTAIQRSILTVRARVGCVEYHSHNRRATQVHRRLLAFTQSDWRRKGISALPRTKDPKHSFSP